MENKIPPLASKQLESLLTPLSDIKPHPDNYKTHPPDQIKALRASLKAFGCTSPIKVNLEGFIVAGHGMYQLYLEDGYTHAPVIYEALDKRLSKAYLVADNETARRAVTEEDKLSELLDEALSIPDFDIESVGFSAEEIDSLLGGSFVGSEEEAEEEAEQAKKDYLNITQDKINIFHAVFSNEIHLSEFNYLISYSQGEKHIPTLPRNSLLFIDSGALSGVVKNGPKYISLESQEKIVKYAEEVGGSWVTMLDIPMISPVLDPLNITKDEAYKIHIKHAKAFKEIQTDVRKVFVIQGPELADFKRCCSDMKPLISDNDVVAIGSIKDRANDTDLLVKITSLVKSYFPNNDIHLFGITKPLSVAKCVQVGATSCDSAAVSFASRNGSVLVLKNDGELWSTANVSLSEYCNMEETISMRDYIHMGAVGMGMLNINLSIHLTIQKQKEFYESN